MYMCTEFVSSAYGCRYMGHFQQPCCWVNPLAIWMSACLQFKRSGIEPWKDP